MPVEASMVNDAEGLHDVLKDLMKDMKFLIDDAKQVNKNIYDGEQAYSRAKKGLDEVMTERRLFVKNGLLNKVPDPEEKIDFSGVDTKNMLA